MRPEPMTAIPKSLPCMLGYPVAYVESVYVTADASPGNADILSARNHLARGKQDADETSAIPGDTIADRLAAHMKSEMAKRAHVVRHAGIKAG